MSIRCATTQRRREVLGRTAIPFRVDRSSFPDVPISFRIRLGRFGFLKPRVLIGRMIDDEVGTASERVSEVSPYSRMSETHIILIPLELIPASISSKSSIVP